MRSFRGSLVVFGVLFGACSSEVVWTPLAAEAVAGPQAAQLTKAGLARDGLGKALLGELTEGLKQGPAPAITVCSERAPVLAAEKAKEFGVRIGRTSLALRNPANGAPAWAKQHVAGGAAVPAYFAGPGGEFGALFPIQLQPQCVQCHGKPEDLAAEVKDVLAKKYPRDRATGFAAGDLRGWFWVEVPKL